MNGASFLPRKIVDLAVAAPAMPEGKLGWTPAAVDRACDALGSSKIAIVGIEVYDRVQWGFAPAAEGWSCHRLPRELVSEFAVRSRRDAHGWISQFPRQDVLFVLEFTAQDAAAEAIRPSFFTDDDAS